MAHDQPDQVTTRCLHCNRPNRLIVHDLHFDQPVHCSHCGAQLGAWDRLRKFYGHDWGVGIRSS